MADPKKCPDCPTSISALGDEAKALYTEMHDDVVKVGGDTVQFAKDVVSAIQCTGLAALKALSSVWKSA